MSQARRVTVYTWNTDNSLYNEQSLQIYMSYLDYDEIICGDSKEIPKPRGIINPPEQCTGPSGTLVQWDKCDRLGFKRVSTIARKLNMELGRRFRYYLIGGVQILVNNINVRPIDPLFLLPRAVYNGAQPYGRESQYQVRANMNDPDSPIGTIKVRFSELPVRRWREYSNDKKQMMGISKGSGVSIIRAGREVDRGWFFMGAKRRENFDDWWRCEVEFDPNLDEAFGLTHTKQQVQPRHYLSVILTPDIEANARLLNARAQNAHREIATTIASNRAVALANKKDHFLAPLPTTIDKDAYKRMGILRRNRILPGPAGQKFEYRVVPEDGIGTCFFSYAMARKMLALVVNEDHPFFRELYGNSDESSYVCMEKIIQLIELMLLAAARSEASEKNQLKRESIAQYRERWSDMLATFLLD